MDQIRQQIAQLTSQLNALQLKFASLGSLPGITQDQQGAMADRLFQHATALPSSYEQTLPSNPAGIIVMVSCDGFYELEPGLYVPFYRRVT